MTVVVAVSAAVQLLFFVTGQNDVEEQLGSSAKGVVASVVQTLTEDIDAYREFLRTKDTGSAYYGKMREMMAAVKNANGAIKCAYTERRLDEDTTEFVLDVEPLGSPLYTPPGYLEPNNPQKEACFASNAAVEYIQDHHKWGRVMAACAPIAGEGGKNLGLVGVDMDGQRLYSHARRSFTAMAAANLVIICLALVCLLRFSDYMLDRVLKDKLTGGLRQEVLRGPAERGDQELRAAREGHGADDDRPGPLQEGERRLRRRGAGYRLQDHPGLHKVRRLLRPLRG
jgi:hypothetical protein